MANFDDIAFLDATAQSNLVRRKEVKPIELVDLAIERIERLNPTLNAVVTPTYEQARAAAIDRLPHGHFIGVPFLVKDLFAFMCGVPMAWGSAFARGFIPDHDSELVARLKHAGLIIVGKTNTPEFGILPTTEPHLFGPSRNPWDTGRTTGGSSGGSAAAVAAGLVPMAHGNDGAGSIRIPASCCGLFGLKPSRARNPLGPDFGDVFGGLLVEHVLTHSVRDSAALLDATCGPDIGDPYLLPRPPRPFLVEVGADPGKLRIAFTTDATAVTDVPVHDDCVTAVRQAAELCADLGHRVEEASPSVDGALLSEAFITVFSAGIAWSIDNMALLTGRAPGAADFEPLTWAVYEMGRLHSAAAYLRSVTVLQSVARDIGRFLVNYDVLLTPTLSQPPVPLGTFDSPLYNPLQGLLRATAFLPFTPICNFTGQPGMSVPLYWNADGLPVGSHFIGRFGEEAMLFRLAAQLESARPWANRRPPVSAQAELSAV